MLIIKYQKYQLAPASVKISSKVPVLLSLLVIVCTYFVLNDCSTDLFRTCKSLIATFEIFAKSLRNDPNRNARSVSCFDVGLPRTVCAFVSGLSVLDWLLPYL